MCEMPRMCGRTGASAARTGRLMQNNKASARFIRICRWRPCRGYVFLGFLSIPSGHAGSGGFALNSEAMTLMLQYAILSIVTKMGHGGEDQAGLRPSLFRVLFPALTLDAGPEGLDSGLNSRRAFNS